MLVASTYLISCRKSICRKRNRKVAFVTRSLNPRMPALNDPGLSHVGGELIRNKSSTTQDLDQFWGRVLPFRVEQVSELHFRHPSFPALPADQTPRNRLHTSLEHIAYPEKWPNCPAWQLEPGLSHGQSLIISSVEDREGVCLGSHRISMLQLPHTADLISGKLLIY